MKSFSEFLEEANTSGASDMEEVICYLWNGEELPSNMEQYKEAGLNIVSYLRKNGVPEGKALWGGRGMDSSNITNEWKSYGASNKTPKTDIILSGYRISLKQGASQLMSGGKEESYATLMTATKKMKTKEALQISSELGDLLGGFVKGITDSSTVAGELKGKSNEVLNKGDRLHKQFMSRLSEYFESSPEFRREFMREACSGASKFGENSPACAEWVLSISKDGKDNHLHKINDDHFLDKLSSIMKVSIRFKSTSYKQKGIKTGRYNFWSVISLTTKPIKESLQESFISDIKGIFKQIKEGFLGLFNFLGVSSKDDVDIDLKPIDFSIIH